MVVTPGEYLSILQWTAKMSVVTRAVSAWIHQLRFNYALIVIRPPGTAVPDGLMFCRRCFFRQPHLRGPSFDRRDTLPQDRNLARIAQ